MIQVAIIDSHPLARRGLEAILRDAGDIAITMSVSSLAELAADGTDPLPDVTLLDLYHGSDQACFPVITALRSGTRVLVVSASGRPADVLDAIRAGARGYLTKQAAAPVLVAAVRTVSSGGFALSSPLADVLQAELIRWEHPASGNVRSPRAALSPREEQTLDLLGQGLSRSQAARRMGVSKTTVDAYVERIRSKFRTAGGAGDPRDDGSTAPAGGGQRRSADTNVIAAQPGVDAQE